MILFSKIAGFLDFLNFWNPDKWFSTCTSISSGSTGKDGHYHISDMVGVFLNCTLEENLT